MSSASRKEKEYQEKIDHYFTSTGRCIQNLIALNKLCPSANLDVSRLRQMLIILNGVKK